MEIAVKPISVFFFNVLWHEIMKVIVKYLEKALSYRTHGKF